MENVVSANGPLGDSAVAQAFRPAHPIASLFSRPTRGKIKGRLQTGSRLMPSIVPGRILSGALVGLSCAVFLGAQQPSGPVRVGGNIAPPTKVRDARPVYPEDAKAANVQGVVVLETTLGADGRVTDVRVLQSIPLLDQAAIDAVRQWEYTPTLLNGVAVPVIMTVTINFTLAGSAPGNMRLPQLLPWGPPGGLSPGALRHLAAVKDVPFAAAVSVEAREGTPTPVTQRGALARDSAGRVRMDWEASASGTAAHSGLNLLIDPVRAVVVSMSPERKEAVERPLGPAPPESANAESPDCAPPPGQPTAQATPLGTQTLENFTATGCRVRYVLKGPTGDVEAVVERWFSTDLQVYLLMRATSPTSDTTYRLTNITQGEPNAGLFQVPPEYRVVAPPEPQRPPGIR